VNNDVKIYRKIVKKILCIEIKCYHSIYSLFSLFLSIFMDNCFDLENFDVLATETKSITKQFY